MNSAADINWALAVEVDRMNAALSEARAEIEALRAAIKRQVDNIDHWRATGEPASPEESKSIYDQIVAALNGDRHD